MTVFHTRHVAPEQARTLFDVALREFLFFAECAKTVANNHGRIIPLRQFRCNHETGNRKFKNGNKAKRSRGSATLNNPYAEKRRGLRGYSRRARRGGPRW